ncbi:hypothetical protein BKK51_12310 [Rodentibacter trehalosifermentans]|uniref:Cyanophage baseplate Pam3 plug gp18 domain-containing protein n=1 Tax=Rodentibacter trehalosifermentans TaxID=1908263 RepID=A0A1V3ILN2_9PAST|nr:hypothetical protein [Rodentibacter trehalosifermentans]OOF42930.1 hypothetical protein BKK51_12310 [Rodentibacter trehalosifermentans]OOF47455.1 hypothetical protein BKK52_09220 [Rodentibacter trehalosifermentans]
MLHIIPLQQTPNQSLSFNIGTQSIHLTLVTRNDKQLFATVQANNQLIVANRICLDAVPLISVDYLPIVGNLAFFDTQGKENPNYKELGSRFVLVYSEK